MNADARKTPLSERRRPKQARANELVAAILEAALQVLAREGIRRFTTTRVAERAGVSVGSIYQYFPNKASILFRLQSDEWEQTSALLCRILDNRQEPPLDRLRTLVITFIRSECEEAELRTALADAAPFYRDAPEAHAARVRGARAVEAFMEEALPHNSHAIRACAANLLTNTLAVVGKQFSESTRSEAEILDFANATSDMFCAYLTHLDRQARP